VGFLSAKQETDVPKTNLITLTLMVSNLVECGPCVTSTAIQGVVPAQTQISGQSRVGQAAAKSPDSLRISGAGLTSTSLSLADFAKLPHKTVTFHNIHTNADETYTGVPLTDLLAKYGAPTGDKLRGKALSEYIIATGSDGYKAVLALAETDPSFHPGDVIVADTMNGQPIGDKDGPFRLVVTEDKRPARCVHNLVSIELRTAD
jgi:DMSO/TMAO reductase YedYZ molybdopterin-dependent catalytic subunit